MLLFAGLCWPLLAVAVPPLVDYPNHLARLSLIAGDASAPQLASFYAVEWDRASTNIGVDLLAHLLGPALGHDAVGRFAVALALLLPVAGAIALGRAMAGAWHIGLLAIPVFGWNANFAAGFLNQQLAVGAALLTAAALAATPTRPVTRAIVLAAAGAFIFVIHLVGAVFLAGLAAALRSGAERPGRPRSWLLAAGRALGGAAPVAIAVLAMILLAPNPPGAAEDAAAQLGNWTWNAKAKLLVPLLPFLTYGVAEAVALALILLVCLSVAARAGLFVLHAGLALLAGALVVAALILPSSIGDTTQIEFRCAWLALLCFLAALQPGRWPKSRTVVGAAAMLVTIGSAQSLWIAEVWRRGAAEIAAVDRVVARLPAGSILLPVRAGDEGPAGRPRGLRLAFDWPLHLHMGHRAVSLRGAFVPGLFSTAGKQPVRILEPWRDWSTVFAEPPMLSDHRIAHDSAGWRAAFTHLLLLDAEGVPATSLPAGLAMLADEGFARLYQIERAAAAAAIH